MYCECWDKNPTDESSRNPETRLITGLRRFTGNGALEKLGDLAQDGSADSNEASSEDADMFLSGEDVSEPKDKKVDNFSPNNISLLRSSECQLLRSREGYWIMRSKHQ